MTVLNTDRSEALEDMAERIRDILPTDGIAVRAAIADDVNVSAHPDRTHVVIVSSAEHVANVYANTDGTITVDHGWDRFDAPRLDADTESMLNVWFGQR